MDEGEERRGEREEKIIQTRQSNVRLAFSLSLMKETVVENTLLSFVHGSNYY